MHRTKSVVCFLFKIAVCLSYCMEESPKTFHLIKRCQRSKQSIMGLENVATINDCFEVAKRSRALAINYSPLRGGIKLNLFEENQDFKTGIKFSRRANRRHFLHQPEEFFNCQALQCPESSAFTTMVNDSRFDYYSLYGDPPAAINFSCVPEIGIVQLNNAADKYSVAFQQCNNITRGSLAHVASEIRTIQLSKLLQDTDYIKGSLKLAYIGLNYTATQGKRFKTSEKENLSCFLYRAWAPGHPKRDCVAITTENTWMTVDCNRSLPYICEIYTTPLNVFLYENACDLL